MRQFYCKYIRPVCYLRSDSTWRCRINLLPLLTRIDVWPVPQGTVVEIDWIWKR